jgi:hypothetical protein
MVRLTKQQILDVTDTKTIEVEVEEWGGTVLVSTMSGSAKDRFDASVMGKNGGVNIVNIRAKLVAACLVDDEGNLLFSEADINKLGKKSCTALDKVFAAAQKLNGIGNEEIENMAKN